MEHSLHGAFLKVARAHHHLHELKTEIAGTNYENAVFLAQEFKADVSTIEVTAQGVPDVPERWGLMAADALQNLRTALNYVAWELSRWNLNRLDKSRDPKKATQFPINTGARQFDAWRLPDLHPEHLARIERLQPNGPDWLNTFPQHFLKAQSVDAIASMSPLAILTNLTNDDKHRTLHAALVDWKHASFLPAHGIGCTILKSRRHLPTELKNGTPWMTFDVLPTGPKPTVDMGEDPFSTQVVIGGYSIDRLTERVANAVLQIVRDFEPVF